MKDWTDIAEQRGQDNPDEETNTDQQEPALRPVDDQEPAPQAVDWTQRAQQAEQAKEIQKQKDADAPKIQGAGKYWAIAGVVGVIAIGGLVSLAAGFTSWMEEDTAATAPPSDEADPESPTVVPMDNAPVNADPTKYMTAAGECGGLPQPRIKPGSDTPQAAVAAFQTAYYNGDVKGVKAALAADSPLQKQNWGKVLKSTKDLEFCVSMEPTTTNTVNVEVSQTNRSGKVTAFEQTVTTTKNGDDYKIVKIKANK